ncbi:UDP-glucosyltransferase 2 [Culex pipiens pallens]|uniref:UDP-glucosyltransferase 2 n=1 Tax=Culex pipiens pallens TaxID=42434 RepID=UPI001954ABE2|nr:UDP-glucosyltransferase 2 [Culex pipiens pallens]XP_052566226.1 UDP-glucosyltransferase 2 [Culex pipiens pallens]XP_052566227.1 UDP-glucosyltransferase 2 [Culex pipiens pallens]XP_052566228.1 UDP-glucosyltransferase 2 [Culex pipiens pallens]XP_052566229.1 UDP-glucosyltransferase 2 [Culex pipiens pallens]XP_052566230.1 UDP-glucosyltransferase 2 [Culex pipiens pallens]
MRIGPSMWWAPLVLVASLATLVSTADILMITMGGTKSHKIPFWELAKGLIPRGHNITFMSAFPADFSLEGLQEITPSGLVEYVRNYTNWDLIGTRMRGEWPLSMWDTFRYSWQLCDATLEDKETLDILGRKFDLLILDGAFPECALGLAYRLGAPYMYINTVGFYTGTLSLAGNPGPYSVTPIFFRPFTDEMGFFDRIGNLGYHLMLQSVFMPAMTVLQAVVRRHLGSDIPNLLDMSRNVSFILQNGHAVLSYPRANLPNVAEIACIHCKPAGPLPQDLEDFIAGAGESGFIYVSMGSSVKVANMPDRLRQLLVQSFARLPYRVLWKYEANASMLNDLPSNVMLGRWLPQQDILGHRKLRAFVTHGGLLSMFETVYHGVPVVTMPVFCDHDANAAKAERDGYAIVLELETLTSDQLVRAIHRAIHDPKYRNDARYRQMLLKDQRNTPLETAIYWTEYVIRHNGAYHLQSPARNLTFFTYYGLDMICFFLAAGYVARYLLKRAVRPQIIQHLTKEKVH